MRLYHLALLEKSRATYSKKSCDLWTPFKFGRVDSAARQTSRGHLHCVYITLDLCTAATNTSDVNLITFYVLLSRLPFLLELSLPLAFS